LTQERDLLKAKLNAAKQRLDAVLAELPDGGAGLIGPAGDAILHTSSSKSQSASTAFCCVKKNCSAPKPC